MYKLKNSYIDKMIENRITSKEIDFLLYIALSQDEHGVVQCVYYKDVCEKIKISIQKFYDIMEHLQAIGLISANKDTERISYTVRLIGNDFSHAQEKAEDPAVGSKAFSFGYLKVVSYDFMCDRFCKMKAGAKLLFLYYQRFTEGSRKNLSDFYIAQSEKLGVTPRSIQSYLKELSDNKLLGIGRSRTKNSDTKKYQYLIRLHPTYTIDKSRKEILPTENDLYKSNIEDLIRINFRKALPEDCEKEKTTLKDILALISQRRCKSDPYRIQHIISAIKHSLIRQKDEGKPKPILSAPLVNTYLTEYYTGSGGMVAFG